MLELILTPVKPPSPNYRKAESARNESIESNHIHITYSFGGLPPAERYSLLMEDAFLVPFSYRA